MTERRYQWSFAELLDRISIVQMKVVFAETEEMKKEFIAEREAIVHDLNAFIKEGVEVSGEVLVAAMALQMVNHAIWTNESGGRGDGKGKNYELSHSLNSDRASIKKHLSQKVNGRIDHKLNYGRGTWDFAL